MTPRRIVLASTLALVALTGCGAVTSTDFVASVDDVELTESEFDELARAQMGDSAEDVNEVGGDAGRQIISTFVITEMLRADLAAMDVEVPDTGDASADEAFQLLGQSWSTLPVETLVDDEVAALYESGPIESGIICPAHILVEADDDAAAVVDQLDGGAAFADVAAEASIDQASAANGGQLGCLATERFETDFIPEFVEPALAAEIGAVTAPIQSEFGFHVIRLVPVDELDAQTVPQLRARTFADRYDVAIDPRFGDWDADALAVVPVG